MLAPIEGKMMLLGSSVRPVVEKNSSYLIQSRVQRKLSHDGMSGRGYIFFVAAGWCVTERFIRCIIESSHPIPVTPRAMCLTITLAV
jgi:hypothetical protein